MINEPATIIPEPMFRVDGAGRFQLAQGSAIEATAQAAPVGEYLAGLLRVTTGFPLPVADEGDVFLAIEPGHPAGGYELEVTTGGIRITASEVAGLFSGVQTLRQLLVPPGPASLALSVGVTRIADRPRFAYRGVMLDAARHFFGITDIKRLIDSIALLKINVLHLHLTDDQGWRLQIDSWPRLTEHGASTQVGGGAGGFYTKADYREIVEYAASRFITIVPEIDMPGHTNAALASYPELNCDEIAPDLYTGVEVGFSSLCVGKERTFEFVDDVISELAELTPGPWIHIGGDESRSTTDADFCEFVDRASAIVAAHGKTAIGWHEMGKSAGLARATIGQYWSYTTPQGDAAAASQGFIDRGGQLVMSPADVAYLDIKYDENTPIGLDWADGPTSVSDAYQWDPDEIIPGVEDQAILGVEAPLWTETVTTIDEVEYLVFPRVVAIAEIAWSPRSTRDFAEFSPRLDALCAILDDLGVNFYREPEGSGVVAG